MSARPPDRFDLINRRSRQVAITVIVCCAALACLAELVAYVVALATGHTATPPTLVGALLRG